MRDLRSRGACGEVREYVLFSFLGKLVKRDDRRMTMLNVDGLVEKVYAAFAVLKEAGKSRKKGEDLEIESHCTWARWKTACIVLGNCPRLLALALWP
jgi:hypothetical protein